MFGLNQGNADSWRIFRGWRNSFVASKVPGRRRVLARLLGGGPRDHRKRCLENPAAFCLMNCFDRFVLGLFLSYVLIPWTVREVKIENFGGGIGQRAQLSHQREFTQRSTSLRLSPRASGASNLIVASTADRMRVSIQP